MLTIWRVLIPLVVTSTVAACVGVPSTGEEGQKCFEDRTCQADLVCGSNNVCAKPGQLPDAGGKDTGETKHDGGEADSASPTDTGVDTGTDGEVPVGEQSDSELRLRRDE